MATTLLTLVFCAALLQIGTNAKICSKEVNTEGFTKGDSEKIINCGLEFVMDTYNKDETCIKVVQVLQNNPERMVDEFVVNCGNIWSAAKDMVSYGEDVYIKTDKEKAMWAVFVEDDGCTRRKYTDNGEKQLTKEDDVLTKDECMKVLHGESRAKILSMGTDVKGFVKGGSEKTILSGLTIFMYLFNKDTTCIKVMRVLQNQPKRIVDELTVTCDKESWSDTEGMVNYGEIIHIKMEEKKADWAVFIKEDGCLQRIYRDNKGLELVKQDMVLTQEECEEVLREKKPIEDMNDDDEDDNDVPGVISMSDISTTGYQPEYTDDRLHYVLEGIRVDFQDYYSENSKCVRIVKISTNGMKVEHMKITCDLDNGREFFGHFQFGHAFTFKPGFLTNSYVGLYNMRDGTCIKRTYIVRRRKPRKVIVSKEEKTEDEKCKSLADGKNVINFMDIIAGVNVPFNLFRAFSLNRDEGWSDRDFPKEFKFKS